MQRQSVPIVALALLARSVLIVNAAAIPGGLRGSPINTTDILDEEYLNSLHVNQHCINVDIGSPSNIHWNNREQFVTSNNLMCVPKAQMIDGTCSKHMDLGTRCAAFCQLSSFYFYAEPINLMEGKICRYGEGCELKREQSFRVEISNTDVDRYVLEMSAAVSPSATFGFGFTPVSIPIPNIPIPGIGGPPASAAAGAAAAAAGGARKARRDLVNATYNKGYLSEDMTTGSALIDGVIRAQQEQDELIARLPPVRLERPAIHVPYPGEEAADFGAEEDDCEGVPPTTNAVCKAPKRNAVRDLAEATIDAIKSAFDFVTGTSASKVEARDFDTIVAADIKIPLPTLTNPTATIGLTFTAKWTNDWTHTYYHAVEKASFVSITQKQVPGEGCGAFWAVPIAVGYCGWMAMPHFPKEVHDRAIEWLRTTDNPYEGPFKLGSFPYDGEADDYESANPDEDYLERPYPGQMWNVTAGRCPVNYREFPYCSAMPLYSPERGSSPGSGNGQALQRTVWRPCDCETGELLPTHDQPREVRQQVDFNEFFTASAKLDRRLFDPALTWQPSAQGDDDAAFDEDGYDEDGYDDYY